MNRIKKILGLISIGVLSISAILGVAIKERGSEIIPSKSTGQEKSCVSSPTAETGIEIEQPKYICVADLLEVDENTLALASYENLEIRECMFVGCGVIF